MVKNDLFRIGISILVALAWVMAGVCIRTSPSIKAQNAIMCYMDKNCFTEHSRGSLDDIKGIVSREIGCAVAADIAWVSLMPCCEIDSLHLTIYETLARIEKLGMRSSFELIDDNSKHFNVTLRHGSGQRSGRHLQFEFMGIGDHYYIQDIRGLCELLTRLSQAAHEQTALPKVRE